MQGIPEKQINIKYVIDIADNIHHGEIGIYIGNGKIRWLSGLARKWETSYLSSIHKPISEAEALARLI